MNEEKKIIIDIFKNCSTYTDRSSDSEISESDFESIADKILNGLFDYWNKTGTHFE